MPRTATAAQQSMTSLQHIMLNGQEIGYTLAFMANRKRLTLAVDRTAKVVVRAPLRTSELAIRSLLAQNAEWLFTTLAAAQARLAALPQLQEGAIIPYQDRRLTLRLTSRGPIRQVGSELWIPVRHQEPAALEQAVLLWCRQRATIHCAQRLTYWAERMGVTFARVVIRDQKTRWGSCSSQGNVNLNWRLICFPPAITDYVIIHELAHRRHMNHSQEFWSLVALHDPDYARHRLWLRHAKQARESPFFWNSSPG